MIENQLTLSLEEHHAKHSPLLECEKEWKTLEAISPWALLVWLISLDPNGLCGKTYPVSCHPTEDGILVPSSGRFQNSGMGGPIGSWTLSTSACHRDVKESFLSDILQEIQDVPEKYYLSPTACEGILRRAEKRGKSLPPLLKQALLAVSGLKEQEDQPETKPTTS